VAPSETKTQFYEEKLKANANYHLEDVLKAELDLYITKLINYVSFRSYKQVKRGQLLSGKQFPSF
jgi:hypothetical protein